mmetsp:Transcript_14946/g.26555  ORF Transcript_14946/g.26555 Transcript_14946/m.26555 type:complete len:149 (-) Transcript_14946:1379-1825(-)
MKLSIKVEKPIESSLLTFGSWAGAVPTAGPLADIVVGDNVAECNLFQKRWAGKRQEGALTRYLAKVDTATNTLRVYPIKGHYVLQPSAHPPQGEADDKKRPADAAADVVDYRAKKQKRSEQIYKKFGADPTHIKAKGLSRAKRGENVA